MDIRIIQPHHHNHQRIDRAKPNMGAEPPHRTVVPAAQARRRSWVKLRLLAAATVIAGVYILSNHNSSRTQRWDAGDYQDLPTTDELQAPWNKIPPSEDLEWHPCYPELGPSFLCARLTVPMDYTNPPGHTCRDDGRKVHIALVLQPATNKSSTKSPMLINPGGPGGSGTAFALIIAPVLQTIFGQDQPIIGFDPRGIGFTTPRADCWATPPECATCPENHAKGLLHRIEWLNMNVAYGGVNSSSVSLKYLNAGQRAVNSLCAERNDRLGGESILAHASTAHVARDVVSIIDSWERSIDDEEAVVNPTKGKLVYWGFSYGTYLGAKFASMFPDRVGRMILDGVVDPEWYEAPVWAESLRDTDKILASFFTFCFEQGENCALYRDGDTSEKIGDRYTTLMEKLEHGEPVTFTQPDYFFPIILDAHLLKSLVFGILYSPKQLFPALGMFLNFLYEQDYEKFGMLYQDIQLSCALPGQLGVVLNDAQRAIMCGDKTKPVNLTVAEFRQEYEKMAEFSDFADILSTLLLQCNGWDISSSPPAASSNSEGQVKTDFPMLFLSNTHDPVTPLYAAVKTALKFKDAGLVEQKAQGHCTLSSSSRCTAKRVQDYVLHGKVPPAPAVEGDDLLGGEWTQCEADDDMSELSVEEKEVLMAFDTVRSAFQMVPQWGV
ncbi:TAP-like protein-domain-containing protein, partial [Apodospora peruviana]